MVRYTHINMQISISKCNPIIIESLKDALPNATNELLNTHTGLRSWLVLTASQQLTYTSLAPTCISTTASSSTSPMTTSWMLQSLQQFSTELSSSAVSWTWSRCRWHQLSLLVTPCNWHHQLANSPPQQHWELLVILLQSHSMRQLLLSQRRPTYRQIRSLYCPAFAASSGVSSPKPTFKLYTANFAAIIASDNRKSQQKNGQDHACFWKNRQNHGRITAKNTATNGS